MTVHSQKQRRRAARRGARAMTLVEVVAATLLVGTLVTGSLIARARYVTAMKTAQWQMTATEIARNMITTWQLENADLSAEAGGSVEGRPKWAWKRSAETKDVADGVASMIVTLELRRHNAVSPSEPWRRSFGFVSEGKQGDTG